MIGTTLQNRYRIESELGRGGMGTVYRAHDTLLNRAVAVKVLSATGLGTAGKSRLLAEAQAAAKLNHPNIVTVYDAGEADGSPFIVMELVEGESLRRRAPQSFAEVLTLARQICAALEHAHASGIIHRDLKPENIVLTKTQTAKLMDFGLARSMDAPHLTEEGTLVGTFSYLAPELLQGQPATAQSDLYALGVMLYELTTGQPPFTGENLIAVISQHLHATVVPPSTHNPQIPTALESLILQLLSKQPAGRPASAATVREVIERLTAAPSAVPAALREELPLLDRIVRGRLVARERELAEADAHWRKAVEGQSGVLLVSGEPGIGKTRLVSEFITRVELSRAAALLGECYAEGGAPYAPIAQIIAAALGMGTWSLGADLPPYVIADLITLAPDLRERWPDVPPNPTGDPQAEQQRLYESAVKVFSVLCARSPVLVVVDDAHWADSGTLSMVRHLARRAPRLKLRLLLVLTYREVELSEARALNELLADLNRERLAERIKLLRFTRDQTSDLLAAMFAEDITPDFLDGIFRETEGNPFFVEEVCKALIEDGKLYRENGRWRRPGMDEIQVPQSVRVAVETRVAKLPEPVQDVLRLAAVIGREFDYETLQGASDQSEDALIDALETAERAQIVSEVRRDGHVTFAFAHALIPATLREGVSGLRLQRLHRRVAAAIEKLRPTDYEVLAHHCSHCGDAERARAFYAQAADRALSRFATEEAERNYRAALELTEVPAERARLLAGLSEALWQQGHFHDAEQSYREAIGLYQAVNDDEAVARLYAQAAWAAWYGGDTVRGLALAREGLAALKVSERADLPDTPGLAELLHEAGRECYFNGLPGEARPLCERALGIAERLGLTELQVDILATVGILPDQTLQDNLRILARAVAFGESAGLEATRAMGRARNNLANYLIMAGDFQGAQAHLRKNADTARAVGFALWEMWALAQWAYVAMDLGDFALVEQMLIRMREVVNTVAEPGVAGLQIRGVETMLVRLRGEYDVAEEQASREQAWAREQGDLQTLGQIDNVLADTRIERGEWQSAEAALEEASSIAGRGISVGDVGVWACCQLSLVRAHQSRFDEARRLLDEAGGMAGPQPSPLARARMNLAEARLGIIENRWAEAFAAFDRAAKFEAQMGRRWYHAQTLREWAEAHLSRNEPGDHGRARELLTQAQAEFEAVGVVRYVDRVRDRLAGLSA